MYIHKPRTKDRHKSYVGRWDHNIDIVGVSLGRLYIDHTLQECDIVMYRLNSCKILGKYISAHSSHDDRHWYGVYTKQVRNKQDMCMFCCLFLTWFEDLLQST